MFTIINAGLTFVILLMIRPLWAKILAGLCIIGIALNIMAAG